MPLFRAALTNTTYAVNNYSFNAYDTATGPTASFATNFDVPADFFANYKALLQAKYVVSSSNPNTSLLYRSAVWVIVEKKLIFPMFIPLRQINQSVLPLH